MTTVEPGSVVVGVDASPSSDAAVAWAVAYAAARRLRLCIVHGAGDLGGDMVPYRAEARDMMVPIAKRVTKHALDIVDRQAPGLDVTVASSFEDPRRALTEVPDAVMVVLGTRGHGTLSRLLLGSVSHAVVRHASCPVTVVRPAEGRDERGPGVVVVGVDPDNVDVAVLELAFDLASTSGRTLHALQAWPDHQSYIDALGTDRMSDLVDARERSLAEVTAGFGERYPDVRVSKRLVYENPADALVSASQTAGHVVVGGSGSRRRHGHGGPYFGSTGRSVVEQARCPVTIVHTTGSTTPRRSDESAGRWAAGAAGG